MQLYNYQTLFSAKYKYNASKKETLSSCIFFKEMCCMCTYLIKDEQKRASILCSLTATRAQLQCATGFLDVHGNISVGTNSPVKRLQTFT